MEIALRDQFAVPVKQMPLMAKAFKKRHPKVGAVPGTLMIGKDAIAPSIHIISYDATSVQESGADNIDQITASLSPERVTWIDVHGFGDKKMFQQLAKAFSIHPLALEDIVNLPQRPKADAYENQLLIVSRMAALVDSDVANGLDMEQVTILVGENYVITFQEKPGDVLEPLRERIRKCRGRIRSSNAAYLAYAVLDTIIDGFYPVVDSLGDHLESLESRVMENPTTTVLHELNRTKNMLVNLRRAVWPQREAVNSLIRDELPLLDDHVRVFLRDTYDHCVQTAEVIEMYREIATGLMNTYLSSVANRSNDVMKVLTIMASVFIPLTFLAGIYGMNFEHMPELQFRWAYPLIWITMLGTAGSLLFFFWRKGWIGSS